MYVKPNPEIPGLVVRDPVSKQVMPTEGMPVSDTDLHYARLLRDGDIVKCDAPEIQPDRRPQE